MLLRPKDMKLPPSKALPDQVDLQQFVLFLENHLTALIDSKDVPGWRVNPAYHPEVTAFIFSNRHNVPFLDKAQALQQERGEYYARKCTQGTVRRTVVDEARHTVLDTKACYGTSSY
ncbi:MAG: hypothetical protein K2R98_08255 [Gemmataceae bacterium]|nr:hypothetical protein [Gemmataceae bacterium]